MIKHILKFLLVLLVCLNAQAQTNYNSIATAYVTTTISQQVVFNDTMKAGGTFTFSVLAHNGGGRAGQSDTANVKIQFYAAGGTLVSTVNTNFSNNLANPNQAPGNPWADPSVPWSTLSISSTNCGGSCANVSYATISMYGVDGSFWAGDYGPWYRAPTFQLNGGSNLAYNPEFGPAYGYNAQGWTTNPGMGACQGAWGGSNPCIVNSDGVPGTSTVGLVANQNGGGPSASGGSTSGTAGGYNNAMSTSNPAGGPPPPAPTAIYMNNATVKITRAIPTSSNSPPGEGPNNAFDNDPNTKYLNFDKKNAGVTVQLNTGRVVTGFTVTTANDFSGRDPTSYKLYGSNDGVTWVLIKEDTITLSDNRFTTSSVISVTNTTAYAYYFMLFPTTKAGEGCGLDCNSMQIAELTYYYDANSTTTSTASSNNIVDPVTAASGPTIEGGTITQTNAPSNQTIGSGSGVGIITDNQQTEINNANTLKSTSSNNIILIEQVGDNNSITVLQNSNNNAFKGIGQGRAKIEGDGNSVTARQGDPLGSNQGRNAIELNVVGNSNTLNLNQGTNSNGTYNNGDSNNHHLTLDVYGYSNQITTQQTDSSNSASGHFMEATVNGNSNVLDFRQHSTGKVLFANINGSNNAATVVQKDQGNHYLDLKLTNGATATIVQEGNSTNNATIDLTNAGGRPDLDLIQSGGKNISVQQSCTNPAGCTTVIRQQ